MDESEVFPVESADVAMQAIKDGVARIKMTWQEAFLQAKADIEYARGMTRNLMEEGFIEKFSTDMLQEAVDWTIDQVTKNN